MAKDDLRRVWNLLVVDDTVSILGLVPRLLRDTEFCVITASSGRQALATIEADTERTVEFVLTDIVMPDMDGNELVARLQTLRPELPVAFMTGYAEQIRAPHPCLLKPFTGNALIAFLRAAVKKAPMRRAAVAAGA